MKKIVFENLENEAVTAATLKKIYRTQKWYQECLDELSWDNQFYENIDNGFITEDALKIIVDDIFREKSDGSFRDPLKVFGSRKICRFVRDKLSELFNLNKGN